MPGTHLFSDIYWGPRTSFIISKLPTLLRFFGEKKVAQILTHSEVDSAKEFDVNEVSVKIVVFSSVEIGSL